MQTCNIILITYPKQPSYLPLELIEEIIAGSLHIIMYLDTQLRQRILILPNTEMFISGIVLTSN